MIRFFVDILTNHRIVAAAAAAASNIAHSHQDDERYSRTPLNSTTIFLPTNPFHLLQAIPPPRPRRHNRRGTRRNPNPALGLPAPRAQHVNILSLHGISHALGPSALGSRASEKAHIDIVVLHEFLERRHDLIADEV